MTPLVPLSFIPKTSPPGHPVFTEDSNNDTSLRTILPDLLNNFTVALGYFIAYVVCVIALLLVLYDPGTQWWLQVGGTAYLLDLMITRIMTVQHALRAYGMG
jgi:hypothetical protein